MRILTMCFPIFSSYLIVCYVFYSLNQDLPNQEINGMNACWRSPNQRQMRQINGMNAIKAFPQINGMNAV